MPQNQLNVLFLDGNKEQHIIAEFSGKTLCGKSTKGGEMGPVYRTGGQSNCAKCRSKAGSYR